MQVFDVGYIAAILARDKYVASGYYRNPNNIIIEEISLNTRGKDYTYATDKQGNRIKVTHVEDYHPLAEDWYQAPAKAGKPVWTKVYQWEAAPEIISISASYPLYNETKNLIGVLAVDLRLSQISDFLRQLKISPQGKIFNELLQAA